MKKKKENNLHVSKKKDIYIKKLFVYKNIHSCPICIYI